MDRGPEPPNAPAMCGVHDVAPATFVCKRCGTYGCRACEAPDGRCKKCAEGPRQTKWWQGTLVLIVGGIGAQITGGIAGVAVLIVIAALEGNLESIQDPRNHMTFAVIAPSLVVTGLTMAAFAMSLPMLTKVSMREALGFRGAPWPAFIAAPVGIIALGPTSDAMHRLMVYLLPGWTLGALDTLDGITRSAPIWAVVPMFALVPGFCEEILFRGAFQRSIRSPAIAIVLSGLLFAIYHTDPHHIAAVLPLGFYLAWLGHRTNSLFVPVTAHVVNNATAVVAAVMIGESHDESWEDWWLVPVGLAVASIAIAIVWWSTRSVASARANELDVERPDLRRAEDPNPQG